MNSKLIYLFGPDSEFYEYEDSYLYYTTPYVIRERIAKLAAEPDNFKGITGIWDMFAGIGCDSISLQCAFSVNVLATELNPVTFNNLSNNIAKFNLNEKITSINVDCTTFIPPPAAQINLVYFDPPWGDQFESGKNFSFDQINLSSVTATSLLRQIVTTYKNVIVKAPYECSTFDQHGEFDAITKKILVFPKQKLKFLFLIAS